MADLGSAYIRVMPDTTGLNARMAAYFSSSQWKAMGVTAGAALGAGLAAGGVVKGLYEIGQAFDSAYDKMRTQTGATGKAMKGLERDFKNVVSAVPADFGDAAAAVGGLSQRLDEQGAPLRKLSKQMLELSRITETDVSENVSTVTRLFGDWSIKTKDQSDTLNKLYRASEATGIQVSTLSDLMVQFGSPLRQLGLDFDTAAAMFSRFEKEGVNIQTLMPGLRMALKNFSSGSPDFIASMDKLGVSLKDGPAAALAEVMQAIEDAPNTLKANQTAFEVFGARAGPDMAAAIREGRFELKDLMAEIDGGKDTIRKAGRQTMDFGEQWKVLKNYLAVKLEPVASRVFSGIGDEMKKLVNILTDDTLSGDEKITKVLQNLSTKVKDFAPKMVQAGVMLGKALAEGLWNGSKDALKEGGLRLGEIFVNGLIESINEGIRNLNDKLFGGNGTSGIPTLGDAISGLTGGSVQGIPEIDPVAFTEYQKVIDSGVPDVLRHFDKLIDRVKTFQKVSDDTRPTLKNSAQSLDTFSDNLDDLRKTSGKASDGIDRDTKDAADSFGWLTGKSGKMAKGVAGNSDGMVNAVGTGFDALRDNMNKALSAFQVKKVDYAIKKVNNALHTVGAPGLMHGAIVPGTGSGDTVPLHIGGQLAAMVEPGEQVSVANRTATAALMQANAMIPRRAEGGIVPVPGWPGERANSVIIPALTGFLKKYGLWLSDAYGPGHASLEHTKYGTAADVGPQDGDWGKFGATALEAAVRSGWTPVYYDGSHGTTAADNHGPGNHAHVTFLTAAEYLAGQTPGGSASEALARIMLTGPKGPVRNMGQAALDKARKAGNSLLAKTGPKPDSGMASSYSGPLDRTFPHPGGPSISFNDAAMLAESVGLPGVTYAQIAIGESALRPGAVSSDGGYGLWQMTPRVQSADTVAKWNAIGSYFNPVNNAEMARVLAGGGTGVSNYYGVGAVTDWNAHYKGKIDHARLQKGGIVPHLKKGSKGHSIDFNVASGLGVPITEASKIAHRLRKLTSERGSIAKLDERISIADTLANADGSLSDAEIAHEVALNKTLLGDLQAANKLSTAGYRIARHGLHGAKGSARERLRSLMQSFRSVQTDMSGVTGKGGRIFDTRQTIAGLLGTSTGTTAMDISGLRSVIEAAQYGAFANLPKFHKGGVVPGPIGQERPIMALGGEPVGMPAPQVNITFADGMGWLKQFVKVEVDGRDAETHLRERQYAG